MEEKDDFPFAYSIMQRTYYEILGVEYSSSEVDIKKAYRSKLLNTHPDKIDNVDAQHEIPLLKEAYTTLIDPELRRKYNESLKTGSLLKGYNINGGGLDLYNLEDFEFDEETIKWTKDCPRCHFPNGISLEESDLEENGTKDNEGGYDIIVQCNSCSLWIQVKYYDADEDVND